VIENTNDFVLRHCENRHFQASVSTDDKAGELLLTMPSWRREFHDGVNKLKREFHFGEFKDAFSFSCKIASLFDR
jgi:pterin-4a-carbinolamine dehydratase